MKKKRSGFTLVEMVIALALTVIILGIVGSMFATGNRVFSDSDVKSTLQIEGQAIQEKISNIGMQAIGIEDITDLRKVIKSYNKAGEVRYFEIKQEGKKLSIIEYSKNAGGELQTTENTQLISENVDNFSATYSNSSAEFNIILNLKKGYSNVTYPINFTVAFRNKNN